MKERSYLFVRNRLPALAVPSLVWLSSVELIREINWFDLLCTLLYVIHLLRVGTLRTNSRTKHTTRRLYWRLSCVRF